MQPKRNHTIRGMPKNDVGDVAKAQDIPEARPPRYKSGTVRKKKAGAHTKVLQRNSEPYRITNPEHHDCVSVPNLDARDYDEDAEREEAEDVDEHGFPRGRR